MRKSNLPRFIIIELKSLHIEITSPQAKGGWGISLFANKLGVNRLFVINDNCIFPLHVRYNINGLAMLVNT